MLTFRNKRKGNKCFLWWAYVLLTTRCYTTWHLDQVFFDFARILSLFSFVYRTSNFWSLRNLIEQLFHSRLLDMRRYAPRWLFTISYPTRAHGHPCPILSNGYDPWMAWHDSYDPYDPYDPYRSWNNGLRVVQVVDGDMHIISNTALQPRRSYDSYGSWNNGLRSWNNGLRVVQLVKCISLERLTVYIQVHDSWNNGSRVVQLVNCIDIYILMISNSAELIPPVNGWRDKHAKDNACSSLWKRECSEVQNTTNILRSQSVRAL